MEEKKCKHCAMMIPKEAKICPYCRKTQGWKPVTKILAFLVSLFIVITIIGTFTSQDTTVQITSDQKTSEEDLPKRAFYKSQEYVKEHLKAPATADFPYYNSTSVKRVAGDAKGVMYEVVSYVDAQNSFGAKIRTNYKCSIVRVHANKSWVLAELKTW